MLLRRWVLLLLSGWAVHSLPMLVLVKTEVLAKQFVIIQYLLHLDSVLLSLQLTGLCNRTQRVHSGGRVRIKLTIIAIDPPLLLLILTVRIADEIREVDLRHTKLLILATLL